MMNNTQTDTTQQTLAESADEPFKSPHCNSYSPWLTHFIATYQRLSTDNLALLETIYDQDIHFVDPIHELRGFELLSTYFSGLYENLSQCDFEVNHFIQQGNEASLFWKMTYQHTKLNKGQPVIVFGTSHIKAKNGKVIYHRDFLDLGAMLYEQLPVLGKIIKLIKQKAAK